MQDDRGSNQSPYRPPDARIGVTHPVGIGGFVPLQKDARTLGTWLWINAGLALLAALVTFWSYAEGAPFPEDDVRAPELVGFAVALAVIVVYIVTVVRFARLVYRANQNVRSFGRTPRYTPAAMVWWYFIPFANLFKPYDAFKDTYFRSFPKNLGLDRDPVLSRWWTLWIAASIVDGISLRIPTEAVETTLSVTALSAVFEVGSALAAGAAVRALAERQDSTAKLLA